jgi:hypothetical protein
MIAFAVAARDEQPAFLPAHRRISLGLSVSPLWRIRLSIGFLMVRNAG